MKKENVQNTSEKRSVNDFEHRMTIQLTEQHYIDYAMAHSQDQIKKGRQRAILWAVLFTVVGCVAIYRGAFMEGWMSEIYLVAGVLIGLVAGFFGGIVDSVIMRIADGLMSFPFVLLALILMTILGQGTFNVILAIGIGNVPYFARLVRGQVHIVKNEEYCNAERVLGASPARILFTHILPNAISPIIVYFTLNVASAIISEAALSFLGMGIQPPTASWGNILSGGRTCLRTSPHIATVSGIFILLTVLGFNLLGDGIRDVFDPKQKQ